MNLYLVLIKVFLNKELFERYKDTLDREFLKNYSPELLRIFNVLPALHEKVSKPSLSDLELCFFGSYPAADKELYGTIFKNVEGTNADEAAVSEYLRGIQQRAFASKLAYLAMEVSEGRASQEQLTEYLKTQPETASDNIDDLKFVSDDLEELYQHAVADGGLKWRLKSLNRALGPLRKGDFGFIFARPETGKTTFLTSEVSFMAKQAERPILWFNNEEQGEKVGIRLYQASLGATLDQLVANRAKATAAYRERTKGRIRVVDNAAIDRRGIERYCGVVQPALIVIDQLDKVKGFEEDREDLRMGAIYQWARELAKDHCPVIGVSQSDGSGEGVKYLTMGNVANAKTSKQAEADWILGIGMSYDDHPLVRGFSICKNKLIGGDESVPKLRHGRWDVLIQPETGRYRDVGESGTS